MRSLEVRYTRGRDLLAAYWGFLANGGLVLHETVDAAEGDVVLLSVIIESSGQRHDLHGKVVRRRRGAPHLGEDVVVAFEPGEPQDLLLSSAWADLEGSPTRRYRRFPIEGEIVLRAAPSPHHQVLARLINVSSGGCCLRLDPGPALQGIAVGSNVMLDTGDGIQALVRWTRGGEMGVEFIGTNVGALDRLVHQIKR